MEQRNSYLKVLKIIASKWHYLLISIVSSVLCGYIFLFFTVPSYSSYASVKLEDKKSELSELISIKNIYDRTSKAESEKLILYSRNVLTTAIKALDYKISFFTEQNFHLVNIYPQKPLLIEALKLPTEKIRSSVFQV